jgi:hypothetical protein
MMQKHTGKARALIARGVRTAVIIAHDNATLAYDIDNITDSPDDIGILVPEQPGVYLFEGEGHWVCYRTGEGHEAPELDWKGTVRPVAAAELPELLKMKPPE